MTAHWPKPLDDEFKSHYGLDDAVDQLVEAKHDLVTAGRNLRGIGNISFAKKIEYIFKPAGDIDSYEIEVMGSLLNAEALKVDNDYTPRKGTPSARSLLGELYLPLDGLVDVEAEKERLDKQLDKIHGEINKVESKLNNRTYVEKVPEHVLEETKSRLSEWLEKKKQTQEALDYLAEV